MDQETTWLLNEKYNNQESDAFAVDVLRLKQGEPLAYIIGWMPFLGTKIYLDSKPLIPRSETEFWVAKAIEEISRIEKINLKVLDMCAGSGCIGVAILKKIPHATCDFVEIDESHHSAILKNLQENGIDESRAKIFGGNLFQNVTGTYDVILANPPYIDPNLADRIQTSVFDHEPKLALFGGTDGMEIVREILEQAPDFLNPKGVLYIEHEPEQETIIKKILPGIESFKDQFGIIRYSVWRKDK